MSDPEPTFAASRRGEIRFQPPPIIPLPGVDIQPEVRLPRWDVGSVDVPGHIAWFLIGLAVEDGVPEVGWDTRRSTPIISFDPLTRTAGTRSGRRYALVGEPGDQNPQVMNHWLRSVGKYGIPADGRSVVTAKALAGQPPPAIGPEDATSDRG